jgi:hypothetical protein
MCMDNLRLYMDEMQRKVFIAKEPFKYIFITRSGYREIS